MGMAHEECARRGERSRTDDAIFSRSGRQNEHCLLCAWAECRNLGVVATSWAVVVRSGRGKDSTLTRSHSQSATTGQWYARLQIQTDRAYYLFAVSNSLRRDFDWHRRKSTAPCQ